MRQIKNETRESTKVQLAGNKMKLCLKCKESKEADEFNKDRSRKDQRSKYCRECDRKRAMKLYYKRKSQGICAQCGKKNSTNRIYCGKCSEDRSLKQIKHRQTLEYKDQNSRYLRNKRRIDMQFKLKHTLRNRINCALKDKYKNGSAVRDLGCTIKELIVHLERQFVEGMSWQNHGNGKGRWNIDHIIPLSTVDLTDREQFLRVCHYTNLRPLWAIENIKRQYS